MEAIAVATLGDSTKLQIGEPAIVIGNALGYGQSVTTGVISALNRQNSATDAQTGEEVTSDIKLIQTDAADQPGQQRRRAASMQTEKLSVLKFLQDRRHDGGGNGLCDPDQ